MFSGETENVSNHYGTEINRIKEHKTNSYSKFSRYAKDCIKANEAIQEVPLNILRAFIRGNYITNYRHADQVFSGSQ